jgi:hypothetical protein
MASDERLNRLRFCVFRLKAMPFCLGAALWFGGGTNRTNQTHDSTLATLSAEQYRE